MDEELRTMQADAAELSARNWRTTWWIFVAALAFGATIGTGAYYQDHQRGYVVFATLLGFALFWGGLLLMFQRKPRTAKYLKEEEQEGK